MLRCAHAWANARPRRARTALDFSGPQVHRTNGQRNSNGQGRKQTILRKYYARQSGAQFTCRRSRSSRARCSAQSQIPLRAHDRELPARAVRTDVTQTGLFSVENSTRELAVRGCPLTASNVNGLIQTEGEPPTLLEMNHSHIRVVLRSSSRRNARFPRVAAHEKARSLDGHS